MIDVSEGQPDDFNEDDFNSPEVQIMLADLRKEVKHNITEVIDQLKDDFTKSMPKLFRKDYIGNMTQELQAQLGFLIRKTLNCSNNDLDAITNVKKRLQIFKENGSCSMSEKELFSLEKDIVEQFMLKNDKWISRKIKTFRKLVVANLEKKADLILLHYFQAIHFAGDPREIVSYDIYGSQAYFKMHELIDQAAEVYTLQVVQQYLRLSQRMIKDGFREVDFAVDDWTRLSKEELIANLERISSRGIDDATSLEEVEPAFVPQMHEAPQPAISDDQDTQI